METKSNVHAIFSSISQRYDLMNTVLSLSFDRRWRKKAIDMCLLDKNDKVLDLFCGTGKMMNLICKKVGKENEVVGLDFNEDMIQVGRKRLEEDLSGYKFRMVLGDVQCLPFEDESFDCITMAFGIRNAPNKELALAEAYRVLKKNGRMVCLELSSPELPVFKQVYTLYFNYVLPLLGALGAGSKSAYHYLRNSVNGFMGKWELEQLMQRVGFRNTWYKSLTGGTASIHYGQK